MKSYDKFGIFVAVLLVLVLLINLLLYLIHYVSPLNHLCKYTATGELVTPIKPIQDGIFLCRRSNGTTELIPADQLEKVK